MENGVDRDDRTGVGTRSVFSYQMRFNLAEGFPILTTKKISFKSVLSELLWFIEGSGSEHRLSEILHGERHKKTIWTANANADYWIDKAKFEGDLGRIYGVQWRSWRQPGSFGGITDQLANVIQNIKTNPNDRRHLVIAYNPGELDQMCLPPCHYAFQFYVAEGKLSCQANIRSNDMFLGNPYNVSSYALLTHMVAQVCDLDVGELVIVSTDAHIYKNHFDQVKEQLQRTPDNLPRLEMNPGIKNIDDFSMDDFELDNYNPQPTIKAEMAV